MFVLLWLLLKEEVLSMVLDGVANCDRRCQRAHLLVYPNNHLRLGSKMWVMYKVNTSLLVYYYIHYHSCLY